MCAFIWLQAVANFLLWLYAIFDICVAKKEKKFNNNNNHTHLPFSIWARIALNYNNKKSILRKTKSSHETDENKKGKQTFINQTFAFNRILFPQIIKHTNSDRSQYVSTFDRLYWNIKKKRICVEHSHQTLVTMNFQLCSVNVERDHFASFTHSIDLSLFCVWLWARWNLKCPYQNTKWRCNARESMR